MKAQELSQKYATAVFSLALERWLAALNTVQDKLNENSRLAQGLQNSDRSFADRQKELDQIIPAGSQQDVRNFLYTLLKNDDIELLAETVAELERMSRSGPLVQVARVTTALTLTDSEQEQFRQRVRAQFGANLEFVFNVDSKIVGGAVVQVGDKVIDGSVATRLQAMSNRLGVKA